MNKTSITDVYQLSNQVRIPCMGFGTWQISEGDVCKDTVLEALTAGYRHIDTAAGYGNETSVGKALKESGIPREEIFLTSKLDNPDHGYERTMEAFEDSIRKLDVDYLDLYLIHWPNPLAFRENWKEANAGSWRAMEELYREGKIRSIGVSNFQIHHLEALEESATILPMVNQIRLCPGTIQKELVTYCREKDMLLEAYSPLATGKLLGERKILQIAEKYGKSVAQICMNWSLEMNFLPLPKTTSAERMRENANVFDFCMTKEEVDEISSIIGEWNGITDPDTTPW